MYPVSASRRAHIQGSFLHLRILWLDGLAEVHAPGECFAIPPALLEDNPLRGLCRKPLGSSSQNISSQFYMRSFLADYAPETISVITRQSHHYKLPDLSSHLPHLSWRLIPQLSSHHRTWR